MDLDDYLDHLLLILSSLWLLRYFRFPALDNLLSPSLAMAKYPGLSVADVLCIFGGFLTGQHLFEHFPQGNQRMCPWTLVVTMEKLDLWLTSCLAVEISSISWFTHRTSFSFNILANAAQVSFNLRDLTSRLTVYCRGTSFTQFMSHQ